MNLHEQAFVESFVQCDRRERVLFCLTNRKKRRKFVDELAHHGINILAPECLRSIKPNHRNPRSLCGILRGLGAPDVCHVISEDKNFDGKDLDLSEALNRTVGYGMGTIISCLPGQLGYFEGELRERYILQR